VWPEHHPYSLGGGKKKSEENLTNEVLVAVAVNSAILWDVTHIL
jgi:hypothetical protein